MAQEIKLFYCIPYSRKEQAKKDAPFKWDIDSKKWYLLLKITGKTEEDVTKEINDFLGNDIKTQLKEFKTLEKKENKTAEDYMTMQNLFNDISNCNKLYKYDYLHMTTSGTHYFSSTVNVKILKNLHEELKTRGEKYDEKRISFTNCKFSLPVFERQKREFNKFSKRIL